MLSKKSFFKRMVFTKHFRTTNISEINKASKLLYESSHIICSVYFPFRQKKIGVNIYIYLIPVRDFNYLYYFVMSLVTEKDVSYVQHTLGGHKTPKGFIRDLQFFFFFFFFHIYIHYVLKGSARWNFFTPMKSFHSFHVFVSSLLVGFLYFRPY
jgi:hypothetical protein